MWTSEKGSTPGTPSGEGKHRKVVEPARGCKYDYVTLLLGLPIIAPGPCAFTAADCLFLGLPT